MVKEGQRDAEKRPVSLLLVEGDTDEIFYERIKAAFLTGLRSIVRNLEGLYNINTKVIDRIVDYLQQHKDEKIRVYCCLDRESRYGTPPGFELKTIKKYIRDENIESVLSINAIIATKQIESWFLYDIEGIYRFLRVPKTQRNSRAFKPPGKFGYKDLQGLFERYGKTYSKGRRSSNFIDHLNIKKIASDCKDLRKGIALIQSQAYKQTNYLFPKRKRKNG